MEEQVRIRTPRGREIFGIVQANLGASKMLVRCQDGKIRNCRIPGRLRKKVWIRENDIVLIEPWETQSDKRADIVWRYTETQSSLLRRKGILDI